MNFTTEIYFKVSYNGRGKTTEPGMVELGKSHTSMVLVLSNSFYKSFTQALKKSLSHACILKGHMPNTAESYISPVVPEMQKKNLTILLFQISRKYHL